MMKKFILLILRIACLTFVHNVTEKWHKILTVQGIELRLIIHTSNTSEQTSTDRAQMDSSGKKVFETLAGATNFKNSTFNIVIANSDFRLVLREIAGWVLKQRK